MADLVPPSTRGQVDEKVDYSNLPCPVGYDEVSSEAFEALNPGYFKGLSFNYCPAFFDEKFYISSTVVPVALYKLGAYYFNTKLEFTGDVTADTLTVRVKAVITDKLIVWADTQLINGTRLDMKLVSLEYMGLNYRAEFELGSKGLMAATYIQRVTPRLSLGGELFWASVRQKSGVGYAARYETPTMVASAKVVSSGDVLMTYVHKISKKVSLATDFAYNCFSRNVNASVGYDCLSRMSRVQGKIDSNGVVYAILEKKINMGLGGVLSAIVDHKNKDYKLGLSLSYGSPGHPIHDV
ncbi:mitochondrial import receptor subunit TOM40-1-like [Capsella rubella]|uniref:mitochondrial import receptor subunit TOM40-1-like n=1 Tax=Capsella rubella TaxID=81985 RepID=UPI000CD579A4|nr:mitochondrial import receptor subunit TOM40-1-like [Capsella rubella]